MELRKIMYPKTCRRRHHTMIVVQLLFFLLTLQRSLEPIPRSSNEIFADFLKLFDGDVFEVIVFNSL
jgi:hypothetical protein